MKKEREREKTERNFVGTQANQQNNFVCPNEGDTRTKNTYT